MRKYLNDYKLESVPGRNGKMRTVAVYRGPWFAFTEDVTQVRVYIRSYALLAAAQIALCLMALFTNAECSRVAYVMIPFAFLLLPLFLSCAGAVNLILAKVPFNRETNDHIRVRTRRCPIAMMALGGVSALAHIPYAIIHAETARDLIYLAAALGVFATALAQYRLSAHFATEEKQESAQ